VVGDVPADHLGLAGLSGELEVLLGQLPGALHGLAAAGGEEDPVEVARRVVREPLGQVDRRRVRVAPDREERQLGRLPRGGLGQLAAPVPGLHHEQPGQPVEVAAAPVVPDPAALAAHDDRDLAAVGVGAVPGEVHPEVVAGRLGTVGATRRAGGAGDGLGHGGHRVPQL
jgi:hypothetical protein